MGQTTGQFMLVNCPVIVFTVYSQLVPKVNSYQVNSYPSQLVPTVNSYPSQLVPKVNSYPNAKETQSNVIIILVIITA